MTKLSPAKPLVRETAVFERTEPLIVALYPRHMSIRLKGRREAVNVGYAQIRELGERTARSMQIGDPRK